MARGKKKDPAQAAPTPEITAPTPEVQEAPETIPAQPEPDAGQTPATEQAPEENQDTAPTEAENPETEAAPAPEPPADPEPEQQQDPAQATTAPEDPDPEPDPVGGRHTPYKATVAVALAVLHKAVGVGTADMLKAVGTLRQGTEVTVTGRNGTYAQLKNGLYILEAFLEVRPIS